MEHKNSASKFAPMDLDFLVKVKIGGKEMNNLGMPKGINYQNS